MFDQINSSFSTSVPVKDSSNCCGMFSFKVSINILLIGIIGYAHAIPMILEEATRNNNSIAEGIANTTSASETTFESSTTEAIIMVTIPAINSTANSSNENTNSMANSTTENNSLGNSSTENSLVEDHSTSESISTTSSPNSTANTTISISATPEDRPVESTTTNSTTSANLLKDISHELVGKYE